MGTAQIRPLRTIWPLLVVALLLSTPSWADPGQSGTEWPRSELHLKILMTALTYESNLQSAEASQLRIGVLFDPGKAASLMAFTEVMIALERQAGRMTFRNRTVVITGIPLPKGDRLRDALDTGVDVLYLVEGISVKDIDRVITLTRKLNVITITGVESYVRRGVALGAVLRDDRPGVLIHYSGAKASGADFSTQLLQLAEIIGKNGGKED